MINFLQIPDTLSYPARIKADLSTKHTAIVDYAIKHYDGSFAFRRKITQLLNVISYHVMENDTDVLHSWDESDPFNIDMESIEDDIIKSVIGKLYLQDKQINWNGLVVADSDDVSTETIEKVPDDRPEFVPKSVVTSKFIVNTEPENFNVTDKSDLYIQYPVVPRFDISRVVARGKVDDCDYRVYTSEPSIPTRQCEISLTTDISKLSDIDFYNLYPNQFIRTRSATMYVPQVNMGYHEKLGAIFPVNGFTEIDVLDNIIKYPHLYKMFREVNGEPVTMYRDIEINGELYPISEIWKELPESSVIPYNVDFMKEYVVRRYLLERDIKKIQHKYPIWGEFGEYLTLISTQSDYRAWGHTNTLEIAKTCVSSRVNLKISRNPVLRRLNLV